MSKAEQEISGEIREKLRKSGEYLVEPRNHFVQAKTHGNLKIDEIEQQLLEKRETVRGLNWPEFRGRSKESVKVRSKIRKETAKMMGKYELELLNIVASKDVEDLEIFAERHNKDCLRVKDT
jgi:hypothetical protein